VHYRLDRNGVSADVDGEPVELRLLDTEIRSTDRVRLQLEYDGLRFAVDVHVAGDRSYVDGPDGSTTLTEQPRFPEPVPSVETGALVASMPGSVTRVAVVEGEQVSAGQLVLVLEAMKMEHPVVAPAGGVVRTLHVQLGAQVETGAVLAVLTDSEAADNDEEGNRDAS
jgi:propionyl-CoA carboxylase alpha chain